MRFLRFTHTYIWAVANEPTKCMSAYSYLLFVLYHIYARKKNVILREAFPPPNDCRHFCLRRFVRPVLRYYSRTVPVYTPSSLLYSGWVFTRFCTRAYPISLISIRVSPSPVCWVVYLLFGFRHKPHPDGLLRTSAICSFGVCTDSYYRYLAGDVHADSTTVFPITTVSYVVEHVCVHSNHTAGLLCTTLFLLDT